MRVVLTLRYRYSEDGTWRAVLAIYGKNRVKVFGIHMVDSRWIGLCTHGFTVFSGNPYRRHRITMRYLPFFHDHVDEIRTYLTSSRANAGPILLGSNRRGPDPR